MNFCHCVKRFIHYDEKIIMSNKLRNTISFHKDLRNLQIKETLRNSIRKAFFYNNFAIELGSKTTCFGVSSILIFGALKFEFCISGNGNKIPVLLPKTQYLQGFFYVSRVNKHPRVKRVVFHIRAKPSVPRGRVKRVIRSANCVGTVTCCP